MTIIEWLIPVFYILTLVAAVVIDHLVEWPNENVASAFWLLPLAACLLVAWIAHVVAPRSWSEGADLE